MTWYQIVRTAQEVKHYATLRSFVSTYISYLVLLGVEIHSAAVEMRLLTSLLFILRMIGDLTGSTDGMLLVAEPPTTEREIYLLPVCLPPI